MEVYHQMRKLKATTQMEERVSSLNVSSVRGWDIDRTVAAPNSDSGPAASSGAAPLLPLNFSPPPLAQADSTSSNSRQGSVVTGRDVLMNGLEEIDWVCFQRDAVLYGN